MADKELNNVVALIEFRLKGRKVVKGEVVAKSDFDIKGDWQNLCHMTPPRAEETDDPVGLPVEPGPTKANKAAMPGATR